MYDNTGTKDYFNNIIVSVSSKLFDAHRLLTQFALEMLQLLPDMSCSFDLQLPATINGVPIVLDCKKIYFDSNDLKIKLIVLQQSGVVLWDEIDITAMDAVVNQMHFQFTSQHIYNQLSGNDDKNNNV